jgi:hypothetical protein
MEGLHFNEQLVNLGRHGLPLFINSPVVINLCHIPLVVLGKGLEALAEHGKHGGGTCEGGEEPHRESPGCIVLPPGIGRGIEVSDNGKIRGGIPVSVPGHPFPIYMLDPFGRSPCSIAAREVNANLPLVFDIPTQQGGEGLLCDGWRGCCQGFCLSFSHSLFFKQQLLHVVKVTLPFEGEDQAINKLLKELQVEVRICPDDILYRPWR